MASTVSLFAAQDNNSSFVLSCDSVGSPEYTVERIGYDDEEIEGVPSWKFRWGPTVSFDIFSPEKATSTRKRGYDEMGLGFSLGAIARYEWRQRWFVESGLLLAYGYSPIWLRLEEGNRYHAGDYLYDMHRGAVQLPIRAGYRFRIFGESGISLSLGTQLSLGFAGDISYDDVEPLPKFSLYGKDGVWRRFGLDAVFGAHFDIGRATVGVSGNLGLTQMGRRDIFTTSTVNESEVRIDFIYWMGPNK